MNLTILFKFTILCAGLYAVLAVCGCLQTTVSTHSSKQEPEWPPPPGIARISFIKTFSGAHELGIRKGMMQQLKELVSGPTQVRLVRPMAVAESTDGILYVADPGVRGVHRFNINSGDYKLIRRQDGKQLPSPVALAAGAGGEIYVSDSRLASVFIIESGAKEAKKLSLQALLAQPTGLAVDQASGRLYVVDTGSHEVKVFAHDGALLKRFGHRGTAQAEFNYPTMIWLDKQERLLVTDSMNFRVQIFDLTGKFLHQFGNVGDGAGLHAQPKGIAVDSDGHIYVVDSLMHTMQIFDSTGTFLLKLGHRGEGVGEFWLPAGIFINANDTIYIADSYNNRIQVFRYLGGEPP